MADKEQVLNNKEVLTDKELLGEKAGISHEEAMHFGALTEEELAVEKKLVRKIDSLIMPVVVIVYLMNYIDRYVSGQQKMYSAMRESVRPVKSG